MVDALCMNDLDLYGRDLNDPLGELYQDLVHRLFELLGSNADDADRGVGIEDMLSGGFVATNGGPGVSTAHRIEKDFLKDDRVKEVAANVVERAAGDFEINIQIVANEGTLGITLEGNANGVRVVSSPPGGGS
jgi:hypothetical protein